MSFAIVFPGQGSQSVGMLSDWLQSKEVVRQTFEEACDILGYNLIELVTLGPEAQLNQTEYTQPALLTAGLAVWRHVLTQLGEQPLLMAGHSLGEYTALTAAGALSFEEALCCVRARGQYMQKAVPEGVGAMAAVLGLTDEVVSRTCLDIVGEDEVLAPANFNAPGQVVIAGHSGAVDNAIPALKTAGAKRVVKLPVSVPSHSPLMQWAAEQLSAYMKDLSWQVPTCPVVQNVDASTHEDVVELQEALAAQLYSPVQWVKCVEQIARMGVTQVLECGPGKVLTGLNKRIDKSLQSLPIEDDKSFEAALEALGA